MKQKIILVTGATNGLGREEAKAFLEQGHRVILHGRNMAKAERVRREVAEETGNQDIDILIADLTSLPQVQRMAHEFTSRYDHLDVLVNNAGNQFGSAWTATREGHDKTFTVNLLAPVLLSLLLVDSLQCSDHARIVTVSSASHKQGGRPFLDDIELRHHYSYRRAYGLSKLYLIWAMRSLHKNLRDQGITNIDVNCTHPGTARTNLGEADQRPLLYRAIFKAALQMASTPEQGAEPTIYAATSPDITGKSDLYFGPRGRESVSERYYSPANEKIIWSYCMEAVRPYLDHPEQALPRSADTDSTT